MVTKKADNRSISKYNELKMRAQSRKYSLWLVAAVTLVGIGTLLFAQAAIVSVSIEAESGALSTASVAKVFNDTTASNGSAVRFGTLDVNTCESFPDENCTGVPAGVSLTPYPSELYEIKTNGLVLDGKDFKTCVKIFANNVTIKRSKFSAGSQCEGKSVIFVGSNTTGTLIEDVEVDGLKVNSAGDAICCSNYTARRMNIYNVGTGLHLTNNVAVEDNYIHGLYQANGSHNDAIVSNGGSNFVIRGNNFEVNLTQTSPVALYGDFAPIKDVLVEDNLFNGGGYCVYGGSAPGKKFPVATNVIIKNNRFGKKIWPNCGVYGPVTAWTGGNGNQWTNNVWDDTGQTINP